LILSLDVGGTFIKGCVLENREIIGGTLRQFPARADEDRETILDNFGNILGALFRSYQEEKGKRGEAGAGMQKKSVGIGLAFPGPFDYEKGISYIRGLNKYDALYGVFLRDELMERLKGTGIPELSGNITILFENDARLFGLGTSTLYPGERLICLTIGTGLGSAFIEKGHILTADERIPPEGYLYNQTFHGERIDDHFSSRGILKSALEEQLPVKNGSVKELAGLAREGNVKAIGIFRRFGSELGEMLLPYVERFCPDKIVVGGQIAKSFDLFGPDLLERLKPSGTVTVPVEDLLRFTHLGIARLFDSKESDW